MNKLQVNHTHYNQNYDNLFRFIDYYTQISLIKECVPENILEIGVGNKTVSNYLKNAGYTLTTLDFDRKLNPDIVGDITNIPLKKDSYKLVSACEVLEHLPWEQFEKALMEIARISKKHVIISIPYESFHLEIIFRFPFLTKYFRNKFFHFKLFIPKFYKKHKFIDQHYWEMGKNNFSKTKIIKILKKYFIIKKTVAPILNSRSYFFILEKNVTPSSDTPNILPS